MGTSKCSPGDHTVKCRVKKSLKETKADCYVNFRPHTTWRGEYGFDWMRVDKDYAIHQASIINYNFEDIVGKHWITPPGGGAQVVQTDANKYKDVFIKDTDLTGKLKGKLLAKVKTSYKNFKIVYSDKKINENYVSYLSIYMNEKTVTDSTGNPDPLNAPRKVTVCAQVYVAIAPEKFRLDYDDKIFTVTGNIPKLAKVNPGYPITIVCKKPFKYDEVIEVIAEYKKVDGSLSEKVVGRLIVVANKAIKKRKILLVAVKTPETVPPNGIQIGGNFREEYISTILHQALVNPEIDKEILDLSGDLTFKTNYVDTVEKKLIAYINSENYIWGFVKGYSKKSGKLLVEAYYINGSGTFSNWQVHKMDTPATAGFWPPKSKVLPVDSVSSTSITLTSKLKKVFMVVGKGLAYKTGDQIFIAQATDNTGLQRITDYCYDKLKADLPKRIPAQKKNKYDNHIRVFYFGEEVGFKDSIGVYHPLLGVSIGKNIMMIKDSTGSDQAHEILHSMGLPHTFAASEATKSAEYTYKAKETDNIMDYTDNDRSIAGQVIYGKSIVGLYRWQWDKAK